MTRLQNSFNQNHKIEPRIYDETSRKNEIGRITKLGDAWKFN